MAAYIHDTTLEAIPKDPTGASNGALTENRKSKIENSDAEIMG
jgi:hypothetical protein